MSCCCDMGPPEFIYGPDGRIICRNPEYVDMFYKPTIVGSGIYQRCRACGDIVKLNKFILGDIHVCS